VEAQTRNHREKVLHDAQDYQAVQANIDARLLAVTQSDSADDAVRSFEASMARLRNIDLTTGYVELLLEVDRLRSVDKIHAELVPAFDVVLTRCLYRSNCLQTLQDSSDSTLTAYRKVQQLVVDLQPLQEAAEGAAPHLINHVQVTVKELRHTIEKAYVDNLEATLRKMNWPKATGVVPMALIEEWTLNVGRLLDLQRHDLKLRRQPSGVYDDPIPLLPLQILVRPLEQRFNYHFSGNKPTNRLEKPEYFLSHVLELIRDYSQFVQDNLQPIVLRHFRDSEDLLDFPACIDATTAFITALIPMLKNKLYSVGSEIVSQPSLLSHLVQEVISFDTTLQQSYGYAPNSPDEPWSGLAYFFLTTCAHFDRWLSAEKDFALQRYRAIVEAPDAGEIDYDAVAADATKPTKSAIRVNDLLETITERYRHLSSFSQKVKFLIDIQIEIFDMYYRRLNDSLSAYLTATSSLVRTMHSISKDDQEEVQGVKGLDRLCRILGSADYLERAMRDWSDDLFFLELWMELDYRTKHRDSSGNSSAYSWKEIQDRATTAFGQQNSEGKVDGALFDETSGSYRRLRVRCENTLVETLSSQISQALRPYGSMTTWASIPSSAAGSSISNELDPALRLIDQYLGFLARANGKLLLRSTTRQICQGIQNYIMNHVLSSRVSFSTAGAAQLTFDMQALCAGVDRHVGAGQAQRGLKKLLQAVTLVGLPVRGEIQRELPSRSGESADSTGDADQDGDDAAWDELDEKSGEVSDGKMSLFQAERLVFKDNEGARQVLEQLGLDSLSESEARDLLRKRIELGS
jgi:hypothetical protein